MVADFQTLVHRTVEPGEAIPQDGCTGVDVWTVSCATFSNLSLALEAKAADSGICLS